MARFDDAKVGDKVKAPTILSGEHEITAVEDCGEYPIKVGFCGFNIDGKWAKDAEAPALFYTNDAGELLTERPKRKVKRSWEFVVHGCTWDRHESQIILKTSSLDDLDRFRLTIGKPAKLIVEVEE